MKQTIRTFCTGMVIVGLLAGVAAAQTKSGGKAGAKAKAAASKKKKAAEISVAFKDMTVEKIASFLSEKLDRPVNIIDSIKSKKITLICKKKKPLAEALYLIRQALLGQGVMVERLPKLIQLRPVADVFKTSLRQIGPDQSVALVTDDLEIVTKEFLIRHYEVQNMVTVVQPMLQSFGRIFADPATRKMLVTDTAETLRRVEKVVAGMDVAISEQTLTEVFEIQNGDAAEIIATIKWFISGRMRVPVKEVTTVTGGAAAGRPSGGRPRRGRPGGRGRGGPPRRGGSKPGAPSGVTVLEPSKTAVTLVADLSRNWIIAVAPAEIMGHIRGWVKEFDKSREVQKDYELYDLKHAEAEDLARQIGQTLNSLPNAELRGNTQVAPFGKSRKLIVFGSKAGRALVKKLLVELDVENAKKDERKTFPLKYADAEEMAERIETLFSALELSSSYSYGGYYSGRSYRRDREAPKVSVVPDKRRNTITVRTDSKTMREVETLIKEEDTEIDPGDVKPRFYKLKFIDPGELQTLLTDMFSEKERSSSRYSYYYNPPAREVKAVGRLLGQFTFQVLPSSNVLIVMSKSVANYRVIDNLIEELDQPQDAGLPEIVELKHANAEDLCEQLNALLAEANTRARIRRAARGLSRERRSSGQSQDNNRNPRPNSNNNNASTPGEMQFWWQQRPLPAGQVPVSNLIGKVRIVPVYRRNALMVLAPEGYQKSIYDLIGKLDRRGRQVVIRARIGEIQHEDQTTLGLRIASDPAILGAADTALGGGGTATYSEPFSGGTLTLGANANVSALLHMLMKEFGLKIMLEPTITTSDNQASEYFDGQDVPTQKQGRTSSEGTSTTTAIGDKQVGTTLRVRPHITNDGSVDLLINLVISRIVPGKTAFGNVVVDRREVMTHVTVRSGHTIMLTGIIRQETFEDVRKVPLLGDIPYLGAIFRSVDKGTRNREMVVFITPHVMETDEEIEKQVRTPLKTLERVKKAFDADGKKADDEKKAGAAEKENDS